MAAVISKLERYSGLLMIQRRAFAKNFAEA
jgi:hypothetical protein